MILKVSQVVGPDLATRNGCDNLFKQIQQIQDVKVTLDFSGISSISRSFAHEYFVKKNMSIKTVSETHVPLSVKQMLEFVKKKPSKKKPVESNKLKSVTIP
jgi:hypothetical protein